MQRDGDTGPHRDGWGIAFYEGKKLRCFHDPAPSVDSEIARLIKDQPIKSHVVVSHIRQANVGDVNLANTHPFTRELWGYTWTFAHNGQLDKTLFDLPLKFYEPVGTTDSEYAFCWLLGNIRERFPVRPENPDELKLFIQSCCDQLMGLGVFNMLLTESTYLFAYCATKLTWITRKAPFGEASLTDCELTVDFCKETTLNDIVTVIATEPLTENEEWTRLETGEMITFLDGLPV